jgi:nicotinamidase-related amidase
MVQVVVVGLATDYCVGSTAIDAQKVGLPSALLEDASRVRVKVKVN